MAKPRKQTYTMDMYLNKMKDKDIRSDADVQRLCGQWNNEMMNELVVTILSDDYIPPMILGEESNSQLWVIDGLQRSSSLMLYRYGNYKVTSAIEDSLITYHAKLRDENGNVIEDKNGDLVWGEASFDIRNKTYSELPDELKKRFNEYQVETVIHEDCDMQCISKLIKRYNNHTSMNTSQKAFTYIDNYARDIRGILENDFFMNCGSYTEKERTKGVLERVVLESVMCMFHLEEWKKQTKRISTYLNDNATKEQFAVLDKNLCRLSKIVTGEVRELFNSKDSFIWFSLFHKFTRLGLSDECFGEFLKAFKNGLRRKEIKGELFDGADKGRGTKDKAVIIAKLDILETLMNEFLHVKKEGLKAEDALVFVKETVSGDITKEDLEFYQDLLEDLTLNVDNNTLLLEEENKCSLLAIIAFSCKEDMDPDEWFADFFKRKNTYIKNQKENFEDMRRDFERFAEKTVIRSNIAI